MIKTIEKYFAKRKLKEIMKKSQEFSSHGVTRQQMINHMNNSLKDISFETTIDDLPWSRVSKDTKEKIINLIKEDLQIQLDVSGGPICKKTVEGN